MFSKFNLTISFLILLFTGCGNTQEQQASDAESSGKNYKYTAVVATTFYDAGSSVGAHSIITYQKPRTALNNLLPSSNSDISVSANGEFFYRIERYFGDNITKFNISDPGIPVWQFSTMDENDGINGENIISSNPQQIVFVNPYKAYVIRYGSKRVWIVNPSAEKEEDFKTGELDLSVYDEGDGLPEMSSAVVVDGKLFIVMQRLYNWSPDYDAYLAVFDTTTDIEIETGQGEDGLKGIKLDIRNPYGKIVVYNNYIYLAGADNYDFGSSYGGIQRVNVSTYSADAPYYPGHAITGIAVVSDTKGYFIEYSGYDWMTQITNTSLKTFNPKTGNITDDNVAGIGDDEETNLLSISADYDKKLWVSNGSVSGNGIIIIDTDTDLIEEGPVSTNINPGDIVFCKNE